MSFCLSIRFNSHTVLLLQSTDVRKWKTINSTSIRLDLLPSLAIRKQKTLEGWIETPKNINTHPFSFQDYSILSHLYSGLFWNQFFPGMLIDERLCASVIGDHLPFNSDTSTTLGLSMHKNALHLQRIVCVILGEINKERLFTQQSSIHV